MIWRELSIEAVEPWIAFLGAPISEVGRVPDELVPLFGTREFAGLTDSERQRLGRSFIQFTAEFFIVLEALLTVAYRRLKYEKGARVILGEEALHSRAFRKFLRDCPDLEWPAYRFFLNRHPRLIHFMIWVVRRWSFSMSLPAAKIEAYSVAYSRYVDRVGMEGSWQRLNALHRVDEMRHVPSEFRIYQKGYDSLSIRRRAGTLFGVLCFHLFLQCVLTLGSFRVMSRGLNPDRSPWDRMRFGLRFLWWGSFEFEPVREMRRAIRALFEAHQPPGSFWIRYVGR